MSKMVRIRMTKLHSLFSCFLPNPSFKHQQHHHHRLVQFITMHQDEEDQDHNLSYYNHHFFRPPEALICSAPVSIPSNPIKFSYEDGFHLATAKKRKPDIADSGRVVQPPGKKDRHSKVRTARGPRDRRVRLSPRTAIQFYDVQDRLGYDRPSKAIDWLIREAQSAIDALNPDLPNNAPASVIIPPLIEHSDVVSGFVHGELQGYIDHQQDLGLAWDCGNGNSGGGGAPEYFSGDPPPLCSRPVSGHGHMFYQREPLQSSFINYSSINADFAGLDFCNELANVTASAMMKEDEKINFCKSSSMAPFLHFED